ncbi:class I SAM-dependent methyltransferase [Mesorhizobium sp.]|uniref:class I SAM-dependent methyltransferase n=1 Tax=Mesorhizobium sp. TaxID=1871066 RepID=UPI000FE7474E|nr:class I SAM-dependent methyltransferase [Mesorhizobium sp.]RWP06707.1 MAG: class I SAM-dependent methyltransferase [Mesorhizobium sp.]
MAMCPVCCGENTQSRITVSAAAAASHFISQAEDRPRHIELVAHIAKLWKGDQSKLMECRNCQFGFAWPYIAGDAAFYNLAYPRSGYPAMKWEFKRTMAAWVPSRGAILEVGAGDGFFLDLARRAVKDIGPIFATEYYDGAVERLRGKGYSPVHGDVRSHFTDGQKFDAIFMFQVLEHMDGVAELFDKLANLMNVGGDLFVAVPNKARTQFNEDNGSLLDCPPNHIGRWTDRTFLVLADRFGFRLVKAEIEPFSALTFVKQDLHYSHRRRSQLGGLAGRVRSIRNEKLRRAAIVAETLLHAPTRLPVWFKATRRGDLGNALWGHFQKI